MNIMIVGGGLLGRKTAETLDEAGHDVVLIDASPENLAQLSPDFSGVTAVGFPMDIKSLRSAGIEGCDAVAVTTPDDNLNITVGQIAKMCIRDRPGTSGSTPWCATCTSTRRTTTARWRSWSTTPPAPC